MHTYTESICQSVAKQAQQTMIQYNSSDTLAKKMLYSTQISQCLRLPRPRNPTKVASHKASSCRHTAKCIYSGRMQLHRFACSCYLDSHQTKRKTFVTAVTKYYHREDKPSSPRWKSFVTAVTKLFTYSNKKGREWKARNNEHEVSPSTD